MSKNMTKKKSMEDRDYTKTELTKMPRKYRAELWLHLYSKTQVAGVEVESAPWEDDDLTRQILQLQKKLSKRR